MGIKTGTLVVAALVVGALGLPRGAVAQAPGGVLTEQPPGDRTPIPRTPDGRADLTGFWAKRSNQNTSAPVEPLPFTAEGLKAFNDVADLIDPTSYCRFPGIPRMNSSPYPMEIVQLPDRVLFLYEYMHNFRTIWTDGRGHRPHWPTTLMGDSVGRWEGDTLVVDTVNLSGDTWLDSHGNRHSDELHVIERWSRISANELWYEQTIDDPRFYTEPWTTGWVMPLAPPDWELMEYACTDNNRDMEEGHLQPGALDGSGRDGTAADGVRLHRQQQGHGGGPPAAGSARRVGAGRHRDRHAILVSGRIHGSSAMNSESSTRVHRNGPPRASDR